MVKFSIVVPVYNNETFLDRCVTSVIEQTYENWELILVNDGSTDTSGVLCDTYRNNYPDKIRVVHQVNSGVLYARRAGMAMAEGEYLCFLDSDDFWDRGLLETVEAQQRTTDADIIVFGYRIINEIQSTEQVSRVTESTLYVKPDCSFVYAQILNGNISSLWSAVVRSSLRDMETDYLPFKGVFKGEDLLQNLAFYDKAESVLFIPDVLYNYLFNEQGLTQRKITERYLHSHLLVQDKVMEYLDRWDIEEQAGCQMFLGVFKAAMRALMVDSVKSPRYSRDEVIWMLDYLTSVPYARYLDRIKVPRDGLPNYLVRLLQKRKKQTLRFNLYCLRRIRAMYVMIIKPLMRRERRVSGVSNN